jgi:hypothetical protein
MVTLNASSVSCSVTICYTRSVQHCTVVPASWRQIETGPETTRMPQDDPLQTSLTLLGRLGADPKDQAAWHDFVARYSPKILHWCRGWGLQESDAQDVTHNVRV